MSRLYGDVRDSKQADRRGPTGGSRAAHARADSAAGSRARRSRSGKARLVLGLLLVAGGSGVAAKPDQRALEIKPERSSEVSNGALAVVRGRVGADGQRFVVRNLTMVRPVVVLLLPGDPRDDMRISFAKTTLETPDLEGSTRAEGHYLARFRTAQDVTLLVRAPEAQAAPFLLFVWIGDELKSATPTQVLSREAYAARAGGDGQRRGRGWIARVGLALAVLIVLLVVGFGLFRRSRMSP